MADLTRAEMEPRPKSSPQPSKIPFRIKARRSAANYNFPRSGVSSPTRPRNSTQINDVPCTIPNYPVEPEAEESPRENYYETSGSSDPLEIHNRGAESYESIGARTIAEMSSEDTKIQLKRKSSAESELRGNEQELINCKPDDIEGAIHNDNAGLRNEPLPFTFTLPRCRHSHLFQVPDPVASQGFSVPATSDQTEAFEIESPTAFTTFSPSAINEKLPSSPVISDAPYSPGKESTGGSMSEIISSPSSPGSAYQDNLSSTEHEQEWQLCPLVTSPLSFPSPKDSTTEQRMPSFQVIPLPKSSIIPSKIPCCGHLFSKMTTERTKTFHKQRNSSNYEDKFYKKKAFVTQTPAIRSPREAIPIFKNQSCTNPQQNQAMVLTRIITETITEYEVEEKQKNSMEGGFENNNRSISNGSAKSPSKAPKSSLKTKKYRPKSAIPKVTIITKHDDDGVSGSPLSARSAPHDSGKQPSRIPKPRLILPGHGDPHLKVPQVISPGSGSTLSEEGQLSPKIETEKQPCRKCLKLKTILEECEATNRYLQQLVAGKEYELVNVKKRLQAKSNDQHESVCKLDKTKAVDQSTSSTGIREAQPESGSSSSATGSPRGAVERQSRLECKQPLISNPLIKKENENAQRNPTGTRPPCAIPKFDFDEFIRKYFKHIIFADDSNNNHEPFEPSQLLRVSIAARDCIYHEVRHKLKSADHILRRKYDILKNVSSSSQLTEEDYYALIDSYRRFVRFIYHYFDESIKDAEKFDQTYTRSKSNDDKLPYYQHTTMTIDGTPYKGVFVPCDPILT